MKSLGIPYVSTRHDRPIDCGPARDVLCGYHVGMLLEPTRLTLEFCWLRRFARSQCPHAGHVREVFLGSTAITTMPAICALYATNERS
jgi:hypothetical protein